MSMIFFLSMWSIKKNLTFWTAFLTRIPIGITLKFQRRLLFPNSNSYDFSFAEKYELFLSEKAGDRGIPKSEFQSEFFENSGFICFFNWNSYDLSSADKYKLFIDCGILQEFRSEKQSTSHTRRCLCSCPCLVLQLGNSKILIILNRL